VFASTAGGAASAVTAGSQSYNYAVPILSLPGRNGLNLNLVLFYSSRVWNIDSANSKATFNADRDFPSYGFRLGFGLVEKDSSANSFVLTEPDGTKRKLILASGTVYQTTDSSFIDFDSSTRILRRKDGMQWHYEQVGSSTIYRPVKIRDTNGNYVSITYSTAEGASNQAINTITDTLGRVVTFDYDGSNKLTSITAPAQGGGTQAVATFTWGQTTLDYNFNLTVADTQSNGSTINVLTACAYPNDTSYTFLYGDWGIVTRIEQRSATGQLRNYVSYNYPTNATALSDHPTFTQQKVSADGTNEATWTHSVTKTGALVSAYTVIDPTGSSTTTNLHTSGWQTGLVSSMAGPLQTVTNTWESGTGGPRVASAVTTQSGVGQSKVEFHPVRLGFQPRRIHLVDGIAAGVGVAVERLWVE
jgi:YD repeat-containing protein